MSRFSSRIIAELRKPPLALLAAGFVGGLLGESLILLQAQCSEISRRLADDLKVVAFLDDGLADGRRQVLEEKLRALAWVAELRYVRREQALAELRRADPELVESIAVLGDNPLPAAYELRPDADALTHLPRDVEEAQGLEGVSQMRYKPAQLRAILQADFYSKFIRLVMDLAFLFITGLAAFAAWESVSAGLSAHARPWAFWGMLGTSAGMLLVALFILPARDAGLFHGWPGAMKQFFCVLAGAVTALSLAQCRLKD